MHAAYCLRTDRDCIVVYPRSLFILLADLCLVMSSIPPLDLEPSSGKEKGTQSLHSDWLRIGRMILGFYDLL